MDKNEYAERVEQMKERLYRIDYLYIGSEAMALDAVYEAVYRGLISVSKLREQAYFDTWITRIVINECKKILRRAKREQPLEAAPEMVEEVFDSLPLKDAIRKLPQELREVVIYCNSGEVDRLCEPIGMESKHALTTLKIYIPK